MKKSILSFLLIIIIAGLSFFAQTAFAGVYDPVLSVKVSKGSSQVSNGSTVSISDIQNGLVALLTVDPAKRVTKWNVAINEGFSLCNPHEVNDYQYQATICVGNSGVVSENTAVLTGQAQGNGWTTNKISFALKIPNITSTATTSATVSENNTAVSSFFEVSPTANVPALFGGYFHGARWLLIPLILAIITALLFLAFHRKKIFHLVYFASGNERASGVRLIISDLDRSKSISVISDKKGRFYLNLNPGEYLIKIESENFRLVRVDLHPELQIIDGAGKIILEYANESLKIALAKSNSI